MRKTLIPLLLAACLLPAATTYAKVGTGIGISFPVSTSRTATSTNTYAALQYETVSEELSLSEKNGRLLLELKVSNIGDTPYTVNHRTSQSYDFIITDKNSKKIWQWSDGMTFTQSLSTTTIAPHSFEVYTAELDRKAYRKIKENAVLATAYILDTPCKLSAKLPTRIAAKSTPVRIHGGVVFSKRRW